MNRQTARKRNSTVTVNRDRRISVVNAAQLMLTRFPGAVYRCRLPACEKKMKTNVNTTLSTPVQPADSAKDRRNDRSVTRIKKEEPNKSRPFSLNANIIASITSIIISSFTHQVSLTILSKRLHKNGL